MDVQTMTYGYGKVPLENIGWKTKGKKLVGWAMKPDAKKSRLKMWGSGKGQLDNQIQSEN